MVRTPTMFLVQVKLIEHFSVNHSTKALSSSITLSLSIRFIVIVRQNDDPHITQLFYETSVNMKECLGALKNALEESSFCLIESPLKMMKIFFISS